MPPKPFYFPHCCVFFLSTHLAEGQQLEPSFLALDWLQLSVDWNNIRGVYCLFHATFQLSAPAQDQHSSYRKHEISLIILSLISTRLQQPDFPLTPSSGAAWQVLPGLCVVGRDYKHNHQSVSTNAAFSLVLSASPPCRPIHCQ